MLTPVSFAVSEAVKSKANSRRSRRNLGSVILLNFWYLFFKFISEAYHYIE